MSIELQVRDGVALLRLHRPELSNAIDMKTAEALKQAIVGIERDDSVRAVSLTGAGPRFCAGGDLAAMAGAADPPAYVSALAVLLDEAMRRLALVEKPVVAAVHGAVAGAGLALMLSCDVVIAAPGTKFSFAYPVVGLTPDCGVSWLLPRAVGQQRALQMAVSGQALGSAEAHQWGLITEITEDPETRALEIAGSWASGPAHALGATRRLMRSAWDSTRADIGVREAEVITRAIQRSEAQTLIASFLSKPR